MDLRLEKLKSKLKLHDSALYAVRNASGKICIMRRNQNKAAIQDFDDSIVRDQFVCALTEDWTANAKAVDWGVDPVLMQLREMDSWARETQYEDFCRRRDMALADKERRKKNELRALAADSRKEFARATNDIVVRK